MESSTIVYCAQIETTSSEARDQLVEKLKLCSDYAKGELGVLKYAICLPDDDQNKTGVFVLEEYVDEAAFNAHMASPPVTTQLTAIKDLMAPATKIYTVSWTPALLSRNDRLPSQLPKPDLKDRIEHPYLIWATIVDPDQEDIDILEPYGAAVVKYATESEPDTIFYADAVPKQGSPNNDIQGGFICAVEVYASKEACLKHLQDDSVRNLAIKGRQLGSKFDILQLNMVSGFLIRENYEVFNDEIETPAVFRCTQFLNACQLKTWLARPRFTEIDTHKYGFEDWLTPIP